MAEDTSDGVPIDLLHEAAARKAGWTGDGPAPFEHTLPPNDDPALGNNGIPPTDAERIA